MVRLEGGSSNTNIRLLLGVIHCRTNLSNHPLIKDIVVYRVICIAVVFFILTIRLAMTGVAILPFI